MASRSKQLSIKEGKCLVEWTRNFFREHIDTSISIVSKALLRHNESLSAAQITYIITKARKPPITKFHGNCLLTTQQEAVLVTFLQVKSEQYTPISKLQLGEIVRTMKQLPTTWNSKSFMDSFMKRHNKFIKSGKGKEISLSRVSPSLVPACQQFIDYMKGFFTSHHFVPGFCFNVDECQLDLYTYDV